jgi:hypothetical protein
MYMYVYLTFDISLVDEHEGRLLHQLFAVEFQFVQERGQVLGRRAVGIKSGTVKDVEEHLYM